MKNKNLSARWLAALMIVFMCAAVTLPVFAYPAHTDYISDNATVLDESTENTVKELSASLLEEKNVRIAVCTVLNTGDESVDKYASSLFEDWKVGNGVLILVSTEDDTFYAVQSNSVSSVLTAEKLSDIINSTMEPRFAEKDYAGAVAAAANALFSFMKENLPDGIGEEKNGMPSWLSVILKIILGVAVLLIAGYVLLVYLERKQAEKRRIAMEARRRRLAEEGRSYRAPQQGSYRPNMPRQGQYYGARPVQNSARPVQNSARPMQSGARSMQSGARSVQNGARPMQSGARSAQSRQMRNPSPERQYAPSPDRRSAPQGYDDKAATVQISTADIRAVMGGRDKFSAGPSRQPKHNYYDED